MGGFNTPKSFFDRLTQHGVAVLEFNPVNPLAAKKAWLVNNRDHRKLLVVDGRIAFVGGINISRIYSSGPTARRTRQAAASPAAWRDTDLRIAGPVVGELQKPFIGTWTKQRGKPFQPRDYFPALEARGTDIVRAIGSTPDDPYSLDVPHPDIDGVWSTVGSTNLDWRRFLDNDEINAVVLGRDFGEKMKRMFAADRASSTAIELDAWNERPLLFRLKEWAARAWERLL